MDEADRRRLRTTFDEVAELYERARPSYPSRLFDDLVQLARVPEGGHVLEIGCGTGQATLPLAERGLDVVCIELGERLAALARERLAGFPRVQVVNAAFEGWQPAGDSFDAVVAFTAFHWLDPAVQYAKTAAVLRERGALAVVETSHVLTEGGDRFFVDVQADYDAASPDPDNRPPGPPEEVGDLRSEIDATGLFRTVDVRQYVWDVTYDADEYVAVLETYSGHRALDRSSRERLYGLIRRRIASRPGGRIRKTYLATLNVAERLAPEPAA